MKYRHVLQLRAQFFDIDSMRIVWHGNYIKYFEQARCELFEKFGLPYDEMERIGYAFPVVRLDVKYIKPCRFNQLINVEVALIKSENFLITKYIICDAASGTKLCKGEVKQMAVDLKTMESLYELPTCILDKFMEDE
jgi:acyl-CoA thioester hydrolase